MIIGLTGQNASGKGSVADYLEEKGFLYCSLSDAVREELKKRKIKETRENLQNIANEMREKLGAGVFALKILEKLEENKNYIIDSIRNPAEINVLQSKKDFILISVKAPAEIRFKRLQNRGRIGDINNLEDFKKSEEKENSSGVGQRISDCEALANFSINNDGSVEQLQKKIDKFLIDLKKKFKRPVWDDYFIGILPTIAKRATCDRVSLDV
jgi:dCMP deaminase